jgi:choline dehydrogenase-like flavoprotein
LFIYGEVFDHDRLNAATHDAIVHIFGKTRLTAFRHLSAMIREGHAVDAEGGDVYMPHLDRVAIPITFLHGEHNRMFIPRSTELTYEALRAANGDELYRRVVIPGYAHMDCWIGADAPRDVFPMALEELERHN